MTAAVADYTPEQVADEKIKREKTGEMSLNLKPTRDIAAFLGRDEERCGALATPADGLCPRNHNEQHECGR